MYPFSLYITWSIFHKAFNSDIILSERDANEVQFAKAVNSGVPCAVILAELTWKTDLVVAISTPSAGRKFVLRRLCENTRFGSLLFTSENS